MSDENDCAPARFDLGARVQHQQTGRRGTVLSRSEDDLYGVAWEDPADGAPTSFTHTHPGRLSLLPERAHLDQLLQAVDGACDPHSLRYLCRALLLAYWPEAEQRSAQRGGEHVSIWSLWVGSLSEVKKPQGSGSFTLLGEASETEAGSMGPGLRAALSARALCGLKLSKDGWRPAPLGDEPHDFLMPGGACVHLRRESCEVSGDAEAAVSDAMRSVTVCGYKGERPNQLVMLTMSDLEALLKR